MKREENIRQISTIILLVVAVIFSSCAKSAGWNTSKMEKGYAAAEISSGIITASIAETDLEASSKSITILFENRTDQEFMYGQDPHLEVLIDQEWYTVPIRDGSAWTDIGIILSPNASNLYKEVLSFYYDDLIAGHYRYIKFFSGGSRVNISGY